jgi:hypothetical protein
MLGFRSHESMDRERARNGWLGRPRKGGVRCHRARRPCLERLEVRITPATATWTGAGSDSGWMTAANWSGDTAPQPGEDLDFPAGATNLSAVNDFPPAPASARSRSVRRVTRCRAIP